MFVHRFWVPSEMPSSSASRMFRALMESLPRWDCLKSAMPRAMMTMPATMPTTRRAVGLRNAVPFIGNSPLAFLFPYYTPALGGRQTIYGKIQRYTGDPPYPFNLTSIRSFSSPSPITMSTSCPLGIAFAVRPSAVACSSTQPFSSCTKPFARSTWPHAGSVKRAGIFCSSCWHERPSSKK